jgi:hypothetical protein
VWNVCAAVVVTFVASAIVLVAPGARADSTAQLVRLTNSVRAAHGLPPLSVSADLAAAARRQAGRMASTGTLSHTPNLSGAVCCWSALGENVGAGGSIAIVQQALMASPAHRANILSASYTQIGVGVAVDGHGTLWVSEIFRRPIAGAAAPPAPPPVPKAAPAPSKTQRSAPAPKKAARPPGAKPASSSPARAPATTLQAAPGGRASRDLPGRRLPAAEAAQFAANLSAGTVGGADPVSRLLGFVLATSG